MAELYRHFDRLGELLYVGISISTVRRLAQHKTQAAWFSAIAHVEVEHFPTRAAARAAEIEAIANERPKHNIAHSVSDLPFCPLKVSRVLAMGDLPLRLEQAAQYLGIAPELLYFAVKADAGPEAFTFSRGKRRDIRVWLTHSTLLDKWREAGGVAAARLLHRRARARRHGSRSEDNGATKR